MNWQPIETAPKDGTEIIAAVRYPADENFWGVWQTFFVYWDTEFEGHPNGTWAFDYENPIMSGKPTHWMPMPQYVEPKTEPCPHNPPA